MPIILRQVVEVARQALVLLLRNRMVWVILGLGGLLGVLAWLLLPDRVLRHAEGEEFYGIVTGLLMFSFLLPVSATYFAVQTLQGELADRTAVYQFVRPVPRWAIYFGKWIGTSVLTIAVIAAVLTLIYAGLAGPDRVWRHGNNIPPDLFWSFLHAAVIACPAYVVVGLLFSALFKRPIVWSLVFVVFWEGIVSRLPPQAGIQNATINGPIRRWIYNDYDPNRNDDFGEFLIGEFDRDFDPSLLSDPLRALTTFILVVLVAGLWFYSRRSYDMRADD